MFRKKRKIMLAGGFHDGKTLHIDIAQTVVALSHKDMTALYMEGPEVEGFVLFQFCGCKY